jgi:ATP-binding cassette, subfamily C (CFTR/MRP), member 1
MDATTEHLVFNRLLGPEGLLRINGSTVIIATHAGELCSLCRKDDCPADMLRYAVNILPSADYIIALGNNGTVIEKGSFEELNKSNGYVRSFSVQQSKQQPKHTEPTGKFTLGSLSSPGLVNAMDDKKRQLGDLTVYLYYFGTLGKKVSFLFIFLAAAHGFFYSFPSKLRFWLPALWS